MVPVRGIASSTKKKVNLSKNPLGGWRRTPFWRERHQCEHKCLRHLLCLVFSVSAQSIRARKRMFPTCSMLRFAAVPGLKATTFGSVCSHQVTHSSFRRCRMRRRRLHSSISRTQCLDDTSSISAKAPTHASIGHVAMLTEMSATAGPPPREGGS